jgi:hypothetical protein
MQNLDKKDSHLVITLYENHLTFVHSDGRSGTSSTRDGASRNREIQYIKTLFSAQTCEILLG